MTLFYDREIDRFLIDHQGAIVGLIEQAYQVAGGHYAALAPEARRRQAAIDGQEFVTDLLRGGVDPAEVQATVHDAEDAAIATTDIVRMTAALEPLFVAFVQTTLAEQPALATELARRGRNLCASFRAHITAAHMDSVLRRFKPRAS